MKIGYLGMALACLALAACDTPQQKAAYQAQLRAQERAAYVPKHSLDFINYDKRQRLSDEPTTIVWCTMFPPTPGVQPITVPIIGKMTSGGKRPFNSDPGPDGMYGSSTNYRYGFTPGDNMVDIDDIATFCTTAPTVWQRMHTTIMVQQDASLNAAKHAAQVALKGGQSSQAAYGAITSSLAAQGVPVANK